MSYIERINAELLALKKSDVSLRAEYDAGVNAANNAYEAAQQDEYYPKLKQYYFDLKTSVSDFINSMKSMVSSLLNQYSIQEYSGTVDIERLIEKSGFSEYSVNLISRCNAEMSKITSQSAPENDIKAIEKLSEYYVEICGVCDQFDKFYYAHIRTQQMEQAASDEYNEDLDKLKNDLDNRLNSAYNMALSAITKQKTTYQQITDKFLEERFAAQIGKQHTSFPTKICLGGILHPVEDYRRDIVSKALSCGNVSKLAVVFEMPLVGSFDDFDS